MHIITSKNFHLRMLKKTFSLMTRGTFTNLGVFFLYIKLLICRFYKAILIFVYLFDFKIMGCEFWFFRHRSVHKNNQVLIIFNRDFVVKFFVFNFIFINSLFCMIRPKIIARARHDSRRKRYNRLYSRLEQIFSVQAKKNFSNFFLV